DLLISKKAGGGGNAMSNPTNSDSKSCHALSRATLMGAVALLSVAATEPASAQAQQQPNIIFIMGDDIGWNNIGVYNQGIMSGRTPNLDRLANEGMRFTDY